MASMGRANLKNLIEDSAGEYRWVSAGDGNRGAWVEVHNRASSSEDEARDRDREFLVDDDDISDESPSAKRRLGNGADQPDVRKCRRLCGANGRPLRKPDTPPPRTEELPAQKRLRRIEDTEDEEDPDESRQELDCEKIRRRASKEMKLYGRFRPHICIQAVNGLRCVVSSTPACLRT